MENEDKTDGVQVEQKENESVDSEVSTSDEATESQSDEDTSDELTAEDELAKAKAEASKYRRLFEKSQKKPQETVVKSVTKPPTLVELDERVLKANGMPDELLSSLKKVAAVNGVSLLDAQNDPVFQTMKGQYEKEQKQKAQSMPASRGSGQSKAKETFNTPGLSDEKHKELWKSSR